MIDIFRVAVHVGMSTNSASVLAAMLTQLTGLHVAVGKVEGALGKMRLAVLSAGAAFAGWEILKGLTALTEKGIEFNHQLTMMRMANFSPPDIKALETQAFETMRRVPGSNLNDILKNLVDLRNISGSAEHATRLSEVMERTNLVMANVTGKPAGEQGYKFAKFLEDSGRMMDPRTGLFSEARVEEQSKLMQAVIVGMRGRVTGADLFQLRQSGKASVNALSDQGLINLLPAIQSLGPVAVGTALQGAQQQLLGSVQLRAHTVEWLKQFNLLDPSKVSPPGRGGFFKIQPGAIADEQTLMRDLTGWVWNTVLPKMMAEHKDAVGKIVPGLSLEGVLDELRRSGLRTPLLGFMAEVIQNRVTQQKELQNIERSRGVDTFKVMDVQDPKFRITKFLEAWGNFTTALGKSVDATMFLVPLTHALNFLTETVLRPENKDVVQGLMYFAGGIGAVLALGGAIGLFAVLLRPFVTAIKLLTGITGLATAATGMTAAAGGLRAVTAVGGLTALGTTLSVVAGGLARLAGAAGLVYSLLPKATQSPEADRAPYGGKSLSERFPNLVVPRETPLGPVNPPPSPGAISPPPSGISPPAGISPPVGISPPAGMSPPAVAPAAPRREWGWPPVAPRQAPSPTGEPGDQRSDASPYVSRPASLPAQSELSGERRESPERFGSEVGKAVRLALAGMSINMDGRKVGQLVSDHQADQMSRPPTGGNSPDVRVGALHPGVGGNWALA